jgi:pyridoxine 4-dehydrogenase
MTGKLRRSQPGFRPAVAWDNSGMTSATPAAAAGTWILGDLTVNRLGFGAMRLTGGRPFDLDAPPSDRGQAIKVLRRAVELGVNHIDTAAFYFSSLRSANELINTALAPYPDDLVITTKVGPGRDPGGNWQGMATPGQLRGQVEENLRQLGRDYLDVVNLRRIPSEIPFADHIGAMANLQQAGLIRHLGISAVKPEHLNEALAITPVVCVQNSYSHDHRRADPLLRACGELGVAFVPFFAIAGQGREGGAQSRADGDASAAAAESTENAEVAAIARAHDATAAQIRLAWTLHQGPHVLAIPGTSNVSHLEENVAAAAIRLTGDELARLDSIPVPAP